MFAAGYVLPKGRRCGLFLAWSAHSAAPQRQTRASVHIHTTVRMYNEQQRSDAEKTSIQQGRPPAIPGLSAL